MNVAGGRRNQEVWFSSNRMRFRGTIYPGDVIKGYITNWRGPATANLVAVPIR